ncbi:hypothetical protein [Salmonella phage SD-2_S15]|nr:hypothetical protein [Salmonella phage SD-2_S15]WPK19167.1 hypothetical protein [Salmonella phage SD-6_S16]WPK20863.1 hypothetical protein [Salmonella phage SD-15_S21]
MQNGKGAWKLQSTADFLCLLSGISVLNHSHTFPCILEHSCLY